MKRILGLLLVMLMVAPSVSAKSVAVGANPLGFVIGVGNVAVDFNLTGNFTLGLEYQFIGKDEDTGAFKVEDEGSAYGLRGRYFMNGAFTDGWVFSGFAGKVEIDQTITIAAIPGLISTTTTSTTTADGTYMGAMVGYHWQWSMLFIHTGFGFVNYSLDTTTTTSSQLTALGITQPESTLEGGGLLLDFSIGLAF